MIVHDDVPYGPGTPEEIREWWDEAMLSILSKMPPNYKPRPVIILARLHKPDAVGDVTFSGGYEHLTLPLK